ncbi:hypothetical protein [Microbulbifer sp. JSM ZJ756]|uniref:hypothetical protein n=1 Tax=Microbulbifer sp. JSM ZJ756 TaxID=3376191 RepID=UPI0037B18EC3
MKHIDSRFALSALCWLTAGVVLMAIGAEGWARIQGGHPWAGWPLLALAASGLLSLAGLLILALVVAFLQCLLAARLHESTYTLRDGPAGTTEVQR